MLIRTSRSTDNLARTTATATRTSPETHHSRVRRALSNTSPTPIRTSPSSLSRVLVNTTNMFRRSASVSQLPAKHDHVTFHPSYNANAPIYVPRSSATHIPTPSHPTPHASSSMKTRGGKKQSTRAPLMTRAPRLRRSHASHTKRTFKSSSRAQQQQNENENENEMENDIYLQEDHENENANENETTLLTSTVTGSWESPVPLTSASMSPPTLSLSHSSSTTSSNPSPPDLILFSDTMSPSESSISMSTASSSTSSPMLLSSSSTGSPLLSFHTPAVSDFELVTEDGSPSVSAGQCGSYLVRSRQTKALSIFKPQDEEMYEEKRLLLTMRERVKECESPRDDTIHAGATTHTESAMDVVERTPIKKGVVYGDTVLKEVAAYLLDHQGWAGVPSTISTHLALKRSTSDDDKPSDDKPSAALIQFGPTPPADQLVFGSLQEYRQHMCSAEDIGSSLFAADEVHKIGVLDIRLLNLDRHLGNLLVSKDASGYHLIPIDHGYTLPSYQDLSDVTLEWRWWRQSSVAFSERTLEYIARLDPLEDARILRMLGIRDESLVAMIFATLLLQRAAHAGLTLQTIASMVCRDGLGEQPSTLEMIISQVLALMKSGTDVTLTNVDIPATPTEPSVVDVTTPVSNETLLDSVSTPMSSLSVHDIEEDHDAASPSSTSLPITITPPAIPKSSPAASPAASPTFSSVSSSYSTSPSCSSLSSSHSSLNNFSLKPSPSIQKLFSFATLPTVSERHHSRHSSQLSHVEDEHENDEEEDEQEDVGPYDHDETFRWDSESDGQDGHTTRARVSSVSSSGSSDEDGSSHRRRRSKVSTSTSVPPTAAAPTTDTSPKDASSPTDTSSPPSSSTLPVVADDGLSDRLQRLLRTTEVVIDREIARIKESAATQPQAQA